MICVYNAGDEGEGGGGEGEGGGGEGDGGDGDGGDETFTRDGISVKPSFSAKVSFPFCRFYSQYTVNKNYTLAKLKVTLEAKSIICLWRAASRAPSAGARAPAAAASP